MQSGAEYIVLMSSKGLWPWFPIGPAGIRTAFFFICGLAILVLRIAHFHVGRRTTGAGYYTLKANLTKLSTYETAFWYFFSSSLFCPIFLWSMPESANLSWVTYFSGDRARANERPLFLAFYLAYCAFKQSIDHFKDDVDRLDLGSNGQHSQEPLGEAPTSLKKTLRKLPDMFGHALEQAVFAMLLSPFIYVILVRPVAWGWALSILRPFYNLPPTRIPPPSWPFDIYVFLRCLVAGTLLFSIWAAGNTAFGIFMVKEPLKNGQPLTSESKDPNGSLLTGLKSKKLSIQVCIRIQCSLSGNPTDPMQCFAIWELSLIAQNFEARRKLIYADIDRKDGPMWSQVYATCMGVIKSIETRADSYGVVPTPPAPMPQEQNTKRGLSALRNDAVLTSSAPQTKAGKVIQLIDQGVQAIGSGAHADGSSLTRLSPVAKKTWKQAKDQLLSKEQQEAVSPEGIWGRVESCSLQLIKYLSWFDALFRQDYRTDLAGAALGTPHAEPWLYINAVSSLTRLAVHSLGEDQFGNVHRDVPSIIRTLTQVIRKVEDLKVRVPVHWTDAGNPRESPEVEQVLDALRAGLTEIVASFEPFSHDLRLTPGDLRLAKAAMKVAEKKKEAEAPAQIPEPAPREPLPKDARRRRRDRPEMEQFRER